MLDACYQAKRIRELLPPLPQGVMPSYIQYMDTIQKLEKRGVHFLFSMSFPINPMAAIFVASGQGDSAVSSPSKNAVRTGVELLSSNVCNQSIALYIISTFHLQISLHLP